MDIGAYMNIEDLECIAKENNIDVPRVRGYRLMKNEPPVPYDKILRAKKKMAIEVVERLCEARPVWNPNSAVSSWSDYTDALKKYYLVRHRRELGDFEYVEIRWGRIHGRKRKILKYEIKKMNRVIDAHYEMWNKYAGRDDVLYIHSRMGGGNWESYEDKSVLTSQPWFLGRVDDYYDSTYCDFYAKIK